MTPKEKKICQKALDGIISKALGGPNGDPDGTHMRVAVMAYKTLKKLKLDLSSVEDIEETPEGDTTLDFLKGKNIYKHDFTKDVAFDGSYLPEPKITAKERKEIMKKWKKS